jgi:hypothetical protein
MNIRFAGTLLFAGLIPCVALGEDEPTHGEIAPIQIDLGTDGKIETMAMDRQGHLLLGVSWRAKGDRQPAARPEGRRAEDLLAHEDGTREYAIKVVSGTGEVLQTWDTKGLAPKMLHACDNGDVYALGYDRLARLDARGQAVKSVKYSEFLDGKYARAHPSGITVCDDYVFVALGDGFSLRATEDIVRFSRELQDARLIVKQQFGCCAHIDLDTKGQELLIAENSRHRVNRFTFEGQTVGTWGSRNRTSLEGFAACCNPVNFDFGPGDVLYTAESGIGRVKRYSADGKYLGLVGYVDTTQFDQGSRLAAMSCYIPVEVSADGKRVFVMDVRANIIRVLAAKE